MKNKIKEMRKKKGITQEQLSVKSNVSRTIISGLESGTIEVTTTATLQKLAKALGAGVNEIFFAE